jgi:hypothetical protein
METRQRLAELAPLHDEYLRLLEAERALSKIPALPPERRPKAQVDAERARDRQLAMSGPDPAPYGYKADGSPRKRPALTAEAQARSASTRRRKRAEKAARTTEQPEEIRLGGIISSTKPTKAELRDREVVHATEEPK